MSSRFRAVVPDWIRRSYLRQFGAAVVVILGVLLVTLGGVYAAEKRAQEKSVKNAIEANTETNVERVSNWRRQYVSSTRIVSQSGKLRPNADVGINITLRSITRSMPNEVVAVHYFNWQNESIVGSSASRVNTSSARFAWVSSTDLQGVGVKRVLVSDPYTVGNDTRITFISATQYGYRYAIGVEVSLTESFAFREPVDGARTRILHRNATVMYGSGSASAGTAYDGPAREALYNMTEYIPAMAAFDTGSGGGNVTLTRADGSIVSYAKVPDAEMAVVTSASTSALGVGAKTKAYLGLIFLFVALSLGVVGFVIERPVARSINRLADRTEQLEDGTLSVEFETGREDEIGTLYSRFASMRDALADRIDEIERAREEARAEADEARREAEAAREDAEAAREEAERFSEHLEATADSYSDTIRACADGDLTRRLDPDEESEAMAEIARAFNDTLADLESTVARVHAFADDVAESTAGATETTGEVQATSREVSDAVADIAADATEQDEYLTEVREEMNDLSATVEEVAATADTVAELAGETESVATDGATAAGDAMDEMETIESVTAETAAEIRALDEEVARVADIVDMIGDIADQTNTLALNASIEAARAGAEGSGFAVVADEVKQLAEETQEATAEIDDLLSGLSERTEEAVADMESMREDVVAGVETTEGALDALDEIAEKVRETNEGVQEISRATDDQAATTEEVVSLTERVAEISDRTAGRADSVAGRTADQVSDLDDVARNAERIESQVADLRRMLDSFTVEADPAALDDGSGSDAGQSAPDDGSDTDVAVDPDLPTVDEPADAQSADPATDGGDLTDGDQATDDERETGDGQATGGDHESADDQMTAGDDKMTPDSEQTVPDNDPATTDDD